MATNKTSDNRTRGASAANQPVTTAIVPNAAKKNTSSGPRSSSGTRGSSTGTRGSTPGARPGTRGSAGTGAKDQTARTGAKDQTARAGGRTAQPAAPRRPIRREVTAIVLLFVGLVSLIAFSTSEAWLLSGYRTLVRGLFGWGFYFAPISLFWGAYIMFYHKGRPVALRLTCVCLLTLVFGAFVHMLLCDERFFISSFANGVRDLWDLGQVTSSKCGGVLSGILGTLFRSAVGKFGAFVILTAAFLLLLIEALNLSLPLIWEAVKTWFQNRPRLFYEPEDDAEEPEEDEDLLDPEDYLFPLDGSSPVRKLALRGNRRRDADGDTPAPTKPRQRDAKWEERKNHIFDTQDVRRGRRTPIGQALIDEQNAVWAREAASKRAAASAPERRAGSKTAPAGKTAPDGESVSDGESLLENVQIESADLDDGAASPASGRQSIDRDAEAALVAREIEENARQAAEEPEYIFPDLGLLNKSGPDADTGSAEVDENEAQLETAIRSFGVGATITGAIRGPAITRYELRLDQGVKLNKITNLAGDIALSLGVSNVRIAPIPDKISTVGVEVPNRVVKTVWLGDVIDSAAFRTAKSKLSVAMGKDISGNVIIGNIARMPHVLIAGTTGSGKSVCINALILSLLYKSRPEEVKMIMIDPKMVELGIYNGMPHLYVPVVTDPKKAAGALQWSVVEMLKRYRLFSEHGVRDIAGYNDYLRRSGEPTLPQVVIIIDELADLMMVASKEVEESICRVAQMGRAAGMHLVVATQRPSSDVITGLMKANIPSRIAFAVSSSLESRIILDQQGAEKLVGMGDMLYSPIGLGKPVRVQGAFVTDEEREAIINFVKREAEADYSDEIMFEMEKAASRESAAEPAPEPEPKSDYDELLPQAVEVIFETQQASVSMLQRRLKLGYSRAARLVDQLEEIGVVGPFVGSKPREILLTKQQWQEMQYAQGTAPTDTIAGAFSQIVDNAAFAAANNSDNANDADALAAPDALDAQDASAAPNAADARETVPADGDDDVPWYDGEDEA